MMGKIITIKVLTKVSSPKRMREFSLSKWGLVKYLPGTGSVILGPSLGDRIKDWIGDHIEPGVSVVSEDDDKSAVRAMMTYVCIGNVAEIVKSRNSSILREVGRVFGKHGGINHILIWFDSSILEKILPDDEIVIYASGVGLESGKEDLFFMNMSEDLLNWFKSLGFTDEPISVPVAVDLGEKVKFSSGLNNLPISTDYDIEEYPDDLRFGDIVALRGGWDKNFHYHKDWLSVGVVVHGDSTSLGHGPGIVFLMSFKEGKLFLTPNANMINFIEYKGKNIGD